MILVPRLLRCAAGSRSSPAPSVVNDIWGGDSLAEWHTPFWTHNLDHGLRMQRLAVDTHLITTWHAAPLMVARGSGLIVEVTDGIGSGYRGSLFYDLAKSAALRLTLGCSEELRLFGVTAVAVSPGFLRSEAMLDHFGVTAETWRDAITQDRHFVASETPAFSVAEWQHCQRIQISPLSRARPSAAGTWLASTASRM